MAVGVRGTAVTHTTLRTNDLCGALGAGGFEGEPLTVPFGGPHTSMPSLHLDYAGVGEELSAEWQARLNRTDAAVVGIEDGSTILVGVNAPRPHAAYAFASPLSQTPPACHTCPVYAAAVSHQTHRH
ncbi:hypothetical protein [Streptomyces canus]|uniref:hypothetical protein n=1 Tax=Streptomyces canus TaxID=58343 RepID=UPI000A5E7A8D|nr:hypothetical protein [Streptomyces canus]